jgi:hypothetical protein
MDAARRFGTAELAQSIAAQSIAAQSIAAQKRSSIELGWWNVERSQSYTRYSLDTRYLLNMLGDVWAIIP